MDIYFKSLKSSRSLLGGFRGGFAVGVPRFHWEGKLGFVSLADIVSYFGDYELELRVGVGERDSARQEGAIHLRVDGLCARAGIRASGHPSI